MHTGMTALDRRNIVPFIIGDVGRKIAPSTISPRRTAPLRDIVTVTHACVKRHVNHTSQAKGVNHTSQAKGFNGVSRAGKKISTQRHPAAAHSAFCATVLDQELSISIRNVTASGHDSKISKHWHPECIVTVQM